LNFLSIVSRIFLPKENIFSLTEYPAYYINPYVYSTFISIPRTHPSTSTISHKIKLESSPDSYARLSEAQRDFRRSASSNEYTSINVSHVSFESSSETWNVTYSNTSLGTRIHIHTSRPIKNSLARDRMENLSWSLLLRRILLYVSYCMFLLISWNQKHTEQNFFSILINISKILIILDRTYGNIYLKSIYILEIAK